MPVSEWPKADTGALRSALVWLIACAMGCTACWPGEPLYKAELRLLEDELVKNGAVACVQAWLKDRQAAPGQLPPSASLACLRGLEPAYVKALDDGGAAVVVARKQFMTLVRPTLIVYPPGSRPARELHVPSQDKPGYVGVFGSDAYLSFEER